MASRSTNKLRGLYETYRRGDRIAAGGQAVLFDIPGTNFVYKEFKQPPRASHEIEDLRGRLRELSRTGQTVFVQRGRLPGEDDSSAFCWPIDVLEVQGIPLGIVMPRATPAFFREGAGGLRTLEFLYLYRTHPPASPVRVLVLLRVLRAFALLAGMELVHGDVAPKNVVWTTDPRPAVFVLDIDGVHKENAPYWHHVRTPEWDDPRLKARAIEGHDMRSDWYALALLIVRTLLCARFSGDRDRTAAIEPPGLMPQQLSAALESVFRASADASVRPSPKDWVDLLAGHFFPAGRADTQAMAHADLSVAQRRRWERRLGLLGPPSSDLSEVLSEATTV